MSKLESSSWSLAKWLDFFENRDPPSFKLRLLHVKEVAERLNLLNWSIPIISVAGTNGKGSTVAALTSIYLSAGFNVGHFTSPHLIKFNERICINNLAISDNVLCGLFAKIEKARLDIPISYFEASLLAALLYFQQENLDVIILEVGMGGRLDATNIIDADLAIITTIDLDHTDYLGKDKESIGLEKAGIMRFGKKCIQADFDMPKSIDAYADKIGALTIRCGIDYSYVLQNDSLIISQNNFPDIRLPRPQINIQAAVSAIIASRLLNVSLPVTQKHWASAMKDVKIKGRLQLINYNARKVLFDVSHNPQSAALLADHIKKNHSGTTIHAVFSALADKDLLGLLKPLSNLVTHWYPTIIGGKRAASEKILVDSVFFLTKNTPVCYNEPVLAYNAAVQASNPDDLIVVYGTFLLVGAVMENLNL